MVSLSVGNNCDFKSWAEWPLVVVHHTTLKSFVGFCSINSKMFFNLAQPWSLFVYTRPRINRMTNTFPISTIKIDKSIYDGVFGI